MTIDGVEADVYATSDEADPMDRAVIFYSQQEGGVSG